jgi:hypothetical protein
MDQSETNVFSQLQAKLAQSEADNAKLQQVAAMFQGEEEGNLVKWQLSVESTLARIERLIRKQVPKREGKSIVYVTPKRKILCKILKDKAGVLYTISTESNLLHVIQEPKKEEIVSYQGFNSTFLRNKDLKLIEYKELEIDDTLFNEKGINEIMNLLSWYVSKEVILSNYNDKQIDKRMFKFANKLNDFIYTNLEEFGLNTIEKQRHFPLLVLNIVNIVDATYRRALGGLERDSLTKRSVVSQSEPLGKLPQYPQINKKKFNLLNPKTW